MAELEGSWETHRQLVEWRLGENEKALVGIQTDVTTILQTLAEDRGSRQKRITVLNLAIPAGVAFAVVFLEKVVEALVK